MRPAVHPAVCGPPSEADGVEQAFLMEVIDLIGDIDDKMCGDPPGE
jgi:hypothetical protein